MTDMHLQEIHYQIGMSRSFIISLWLSGSHPMKSSGVLLRLKNWPDSQGWVSTSKQAGEVKTVGDLLDAAQML